MNRPDHDDFWLMAEAVQDLDSAAEDVGFERTVATAADMESLIYMAQQRLLRSEMQGGASDEVKKIALWCDGFMLGQQFAKLKAKRERRLL